MKLVLEHMKEPSKPTSFPEIFCRFLESLCNRRNMSQTIGNIKSLEPYFFGFDHIKMLEVYTDGETLYNKMHVQKTNQNNYSGLWKDFCIGSLDGARYLHRYSTYIDFLEFVNYFDKTADTRAALACFIGQGIHGMKFALACDFLKEMGFPNYSKPDSHLKDILTSKGFDISSESELEIFRTVALLADEVGETPYAVDRVFWLIGSGNLYRNHRTFKTDKEEFVRQTREIWAKENPPSRTR
jgi:hypothetical protein